MSYYDNVVCPSENGLFCNFQEVVLMSLDKYIQYHCKSKEPQKIVLNTFGDLQDGFNFYFNVYDKDGKVVGKATAKVTLVEGNDDVRNVAFNINTSNASNSLTQQVPASDDFLKTLTDKFVKDDSIYIKPTRAKRIVEQEEKSVEQETEQIDEHDTGLIISTDKEDDAALDLLADLTGEETVGTPEQNTNDTTTVEQEKEKVEPTEPKDFKIATEIEDTADAEQQQSDIEQIQSNAKKLIDDAYETLSTKQKGQFANGKASKENLMQIINETDGEVSLYYAPHGSDKRWYVAFNDEYTQYKPLEITSSERSILQKIFGIKDTDIQEKFKTNLSNDNQIFSHNLSVTQNAEKEFWDDEYTIVDKEDGSLILNLKVSGELLKIVQTDKRIKDFWIALKERLETFGNGEKVYNDFSFEFMNPYDSGCSYVNIVINEDEIMVTRGGYETGNYGTDSYTRWEHHIYIDGGDDLEEGEYFDFEDEIKCDESTILNIEFPSEYSLD